MDPVECFDQIVVFRSDVVPPSSDTVNEDQLDEIVDLLKEALENRVLLLSKISIPAGNEISWKAVGFKLNGHYANQILTKGPTSDSHEGHSFREFWGGKSQLRRVDGDLIECVLWSAKRNVIQQIIDYKLDSYSKNLASPFLCSWNHVLPNRLQPMLLSNLGAATECLHLTSSLRLIRSMDKLRSLLRGLNEKLPLNVTGIFPLSAAFRDTSTFVPTLTVPSAANGVRWSKNVAQVDQPQPSSIVYPIFPLYVTITLETSGKWPDELDCFLHMKRLLVIRIHELLSSISIPSHVTSDSMLDVFLDGLIFRVSITQPRELHLLQKSAEKQLPDSPILSSSSGDPTTWLRFNQYMPTIAGLLASVSRGHSHVFPPACRLAKRWLSAHGFPVIQCPFESEMDGLRQISFDTAVLESETEISEHILLGSDPMCVSHNGCRISEIAVELMMVYACGLSQPTPDEDHNSVQLKGGISGMGVTCSSTVAFLRFLKLLATYDWEHRPLLVDLNGGFLNIQKRREALSSMEKDRGLLPAMVICTPEDAEGVQWTSVGPSRQGLQHLQRLASQTRQLLRAMLVADAKLKDLKTIFRPCLKNLNVLIKLRSQTLRVRSIESIFPQKKSKHSSNFSLQKPQTVDSEDLPSEIPPPGASFWPMGYCYDPLAYLVRLLQIHLGSVCEIYWDRHGGDWIGLRWLPSVMDEQSPSPPEFAPHKLDGLCTHKRNDTRTQMFLKHRLHTVTDLLLRWVPNFVKSVQLTNGEASSQTPNRVAGKSVSRKRVSDS